MCRVTGRKQCIHRIDYVDNEGEFYLWLRNVSKNGVDSVGVRRCYGRGIVSLTGGGRCTDWFVYSGDTGDTAA